MPKEYTEQELDATLRTHLSAELDGQLGRAGHAFEAHVKFAHSAATAPARAAGSRSVRTRLWVIGFMGAAVAASIASIWLLPVTPPQAGTPVVLSTQPAGHGSGVVSGEASTSPTSPDTSPDDAPQWEQVERLVNSVTLDRGPVVLENNTPARLVRRVALEETEWVDERRGVRMRAVVPRQDVRLISLDTY